MQIQVLSSQNLQQRHPSVNRDVERAHKKTINLNSDTQYPLLFIRHVMQISCISEAVILSHVAFALKKEFSFIIVIIILLLAFIWEWGEFQATSRLYSGLTLNSVFTDHSWQARENCMWCLRLNPLILSLQPKLSLFRVRTGLTVTVYLFGPSSSLVLLLFSFLKAKQLFLFDFVVLKVNKQRVLKANSKSLFAFLKSLHLEKLLHNKQ